MNSTVAVTVAVFVCCSLAAAGLWRAQRERLAFATLIGAPLLASLVAVVMLPRSSDAAAARSPHESGAATAAADGPQGASGTGGSVAPVATVAMSAGGAGPVVEALRKEAADDRAARRFSDAREAYARLVKATPNDADAWADLADATAAAANGDLAAGRPALERALTVDPNHPKALWLKASLAFQEKRYRDAEGVWQQLLKLLPPDSNDARIVTANLEETRTLAAGKGVAR